MPKSPTADPGEKTKKAKTKSSARKAASPEEHYRLLQSEAYRIAERDGFKEGKELDYWLMAEKSVGKKQETLT